MKYKKIGYVLFFIIIFYGVFLRVFSINSHSLWTDEGYSFGASNNLLYQGDLILESGYNYSSSFFIFHFFQAISLFIFGQNEFGLRIPSLLSSVIFFISSFFLIKDMTKKVNKKSNLVFAFIAFIVFVFSYWQIAWSIQGRVYALLQLFVFFGFYFMWKFFMESKLKKKIYYLIFFITFALFASFTHVYGISLFSLFFIFFPIIDFKHFKQKKFLVFYFLFLTAFLFWKNRTFLSYVSEYSYFFDSYSSFIFNSHFAIFIFAFISLFLSFVFGGKVHRKLTFFLFFPCFFSFISFSFFVNRASFRYLFPVYPLFVLLSFSFILLHIRKEIKIFIFIIYLITIFSVDLHKLLNRKFETEIYFQYPELSFRPREKYFLPFGHPKYDPRIIFPQPDFRTAFTKIKEKKKKDQILIVTFPQISRFYGVEPDFILPIENKYHEDIKNISHAPKHIYTNIHRIKSNKEIKEIIKSNNGFIVADKYSMLYTPKKIQNFIYNNTKLIYRKKDNYDSVVYIFYF